MRSFLRLIPSPTNHSMEKFIQNWCQCSSVPGLQKYSISICSNSRVRNVKFPGVISFLKDFPCCAIPNGIVGFVDFTTLSKSTNIACAVSGLRYIVFSLSSTGPMLVLNIRLNMRGWSSVPLHMGQFSVSSVSARCLRLHSLHWTSGSVKLSTCPLAIHTLGCMSIEASIPSTSSRSRTIDFHHWSLTLRLSSVPTGP